jgi:FKBP-type peptidyl-prolyl cis-trans isomerase
VLKKALSREAMKWKFLIGVLLLVATLSCTKTPTIVPSNVQLANDIATIDEYLKDNGITAVKDTTGIRYVIQTLGTGVTPTNKNCIRIKYQGRFLSDGTVFDQNESLKYPLGGFILGWQLAFQHFPGGTKATIYIPSGFAYGASARNGIPANSNLVFDVELFEVYAYNSQSAYCYDDPLILPELQLAKDVAAIDKYLADNSISAITEASGLRYKVQSLGAGEKPTTSNCVKVKYTGKLMSGGAIFDTNDIGFKSPLIRLIKGWQTALQIFPNGTKATLYIPSGLAYGPTGSGARIPPNANLIFDIELIDVTQYNATSDTCN